jgi:hypothetical protein
MSRTLLIGTSSIAYKYVKDAYKRSSLLQRSFKVEVPQELNKIIQQVVQKVVQTAKHLRIKIITGFWRLNFRQILMKYR